MNNPFDNEGNPFADAAVIEAADNENDYEDPQPKKKGDKERLFSGPSSSGNVPPAYDNQDDALRRKEEELRRKERELQEKQRQLEQQQYKQQPSPPSQQQQQQPQDGPRVKQPNWPICKPFIYHSIPDEIPQEWQRTVLNLYYSWLLTVACLGTNLIGCLCVLIAGVNPTDFGVSIMYFFVITVCSFFLWYRPVYNAFMKDTSFYFLMFLAFGGCHILFEAYMLIGITETGSAGMVNMIYLFSNAHIGEGVICLISTIFWLILLLFHLYLYRIVYTVYKARGHSVAAARNEAVTSAVNSDAGRQAVTSAVTGVANSYMQGGNNA